MEKYYFVLANRTHESKLSGHAHTLAGVRHIFKKVTNATVCEVYKRCGITYETKPFITYQK